MKAAIERGCSLLRRHEAYDHSLIFVDDLIVPKLAASHAPTATLRVPPASVTTSQLANVEIGLNTIKR